MFNPDFKFSHHKAIALILLVVSVFLLKQMRTDLKAGPLVVESYPSHVAESEVVDYGSAREPLIGALDSVDVESDPNDDIFPVGNLNSYSAQDRVLIESVISIIQGYYVDNHRVSNSDLYGSSLSVLKKILPDFEKSGGLIKFKDGEKIYSFLDRSGKRISYNTLLKQIMRHHSLGQKVLKKRGNQEEHVVLRGMLQNLDAHSTMLLPQDYEDLKQGTEGVFGGLGVLVGMRNDVLTVIKPIPNSPAARMGISRNDKILSIDGHKTYGATLDDLIEHMRGKPGTQVQLEILKDNAPSPTKFTLKREVIKVDSVTSKIFKNGKNEFLYISIDNFAARTTVELSGAIKDFRKKHKGSIPGLVLDLRSNPGGLLDQAVSVADLFLKEGVIVSTRGRRSEVERATVGESETDFPMVVLINSDSASASEIVAGALQDHGRALVIGQQSFGKGSVQTVFELPGQRAIKLTIARYYTPKGRTIQNEGILPDIVFQPVFVKNENSNLLGDYRYRGEGALNHALTTKSLLKRNNSRAIFQSFYLADKLNQYDLSPGADREFELSKIFLKSISEHYGNNIPKGLRRVDHQLFIASKEIQNYLRYQSTSVTKFLSEKFKVRWGGKKFGSEKLSLQIRSTERIPVIPGKNAIIPIRIFNTGDEQVNNVSISLQTEQAGMISREILIGMVPPRHYSSKYFD